MSEHTDSRIDYEGPGAILTASGARIEGHLVVSGFSRQHYADTSTMPGGAPRRTPTIVSLIFDAELTPDVALSDGERSELGPLSEIHVEFPLEREIQRVQAMVGLATDPGVVTLERDDRKLRRA